MRYAEAMLIAMAGVAAMAFAMTHPIERPHYELWVFIINNVSGERAGYTRVNDKVYTDEMDCEIDLLSADVPPGPTGWHYELGCLKRGPRERDT